MTPSARIEQNKLFLALAEPDPALHSQLTRDGYGKINGAYERAIPLNFPYAETIRDNYVNLAQSFYRDECHPTINWQNGLTHFAAIASDADLFWWTTGRVALALRGADIAVNDLDFYFRQEDLPRVYDAFHPYIIEPIVDTEGTWREGSFAYCGLAYLHCPICLFVGALPTFDVPPRRTSAPTLKPTLKRSSGMASRLRRRRSLYTSKPSSVGGALRPPRKHAYS